MSLEPEVVHTIIPPADSEFERVARPKCSIPNSVIVQFTTAYSYNILRCVEPGPAPAPVGRSVALVVDLLVEPLLRLVLRLLLVEEVHL